MRRSTGCSLMEYLLYLQGRKYCIYPNPPVVPSFLFSKKTMIYPGSSPPHTWHFQNLSKSDGRMIRSVGETPQENENVMLQYV
mmetsp:Transcript_3583/g.5251  ORF Transcript_3583/g.5251 Transcript_3583/m.5251 type:complete len:83 (+) Transcript_3583:117-365(+)